MLVLIGFASYLYAIPVTISNQTDWDNYLSTLVANTIPAADVVTIPAAGNLDILVDVVNNGTINITGGTSVEIKDNVTFTNNGTLLCVNSTLELENNSTLINHGNFTLDNCTFDPEQNTSVFTNYGVTTTTNNLECTSYGTINNFGTLNMNHHFDDISLELPAVFNNCGTISGDPSAEISVKGVFNTNVLVTSITISGNPQTITATGCPAPIPTLGQWGTIILLLFFLIMGIVAFKLQNPIVI